MEKSEVLTRYSVLIVELVASCSRLSCIRVKLSLVVLIVILLVSYFFTITWKVHPILQLLKILKVYYILSSRKGGSSCWKDFREKFEKLWKLWVEKVFEAFLLFLRWHLLSGTSFAKYYTQAYLQLPYFVHYFIYLPWKVFSCSLLIENQNFYVQTRINWCCSSSYRQLFLWRQKSTTGGNEFISKSTHPNSIFLYSTVV